MWGRGKKLPAERRPALERDERVLGWARTTDDGTVVTTNRGLWLPGRAERLGWHEIHKATWDNPRLTITPGAPVGDGDGYTIMADQPPIRVSLTDPGDVPSQINTRVTRSVAVSTHHTLAAGGAVRVVGRRVPGVDGVTWHVRYDEGTDAHDPLVVLQTAQLVAEAAYVPTE
ncbi:hypothetical protein [Luedemannella helvata]|uniref:Uncharacterized protein n=1 Tax=Luedemannella helvata TaxID=349315 RepID=A0ABP4W203_9ACTN